MAVALTGTMLWLSPTGVGQTAGINQGGPGYLHAPAGTDATAQHGGSEAATKLEQMRQAERRRRVAEDGAKLVVLSNELKTAIDQAPKDQLSLDVIRKAAEIEKVARDVKDWMKS